MRDVILMAAAAALASAMLIGCTPGGDRGALEVTQSWNARPVGPVPGSSMTSPLWIAR